MHRFIQISLNHLNKSLKYTDKNVLNQNKQSITARYLINSLKFSTSSTLNESDKKENINIGTIGNFLFFYNQFYYKNIPF